VAGLIGAERSQVRAAAAAMLRRCAHFIGLAHFF
jgi:hypothetical protein